MTEGELETASRDGVAMLSVIVPFHRNLDYLNRSLSAIRASIARAAVAAEIIVVADGSPEDSQGIIESNGAQLLAIPGPSGPAVARNRGAAIAHGEWLVFVDSDVVVHSTAIARLAAAWANAPHLGAVFGAYDEDPDHPGFLSQGRNLAHSFIHQRGNRNASTFWAGLGAVRRAAFLAVDGFDERFRRPSVEDIDLGYRLRRAGYQIALDPSIQGKHLKHWTVWNSVRTDVRDRGVPWTQLLHRYVALRDDLNVSRAYRACVVVAYLSVLLLAGAWWQPVLLVPFVAGLAALLWLDASYYAFFLRKRGVLFTAGWYAVHVVHHLLNGVSFVAGTTLFLLRRGGVRGPGALPTDAWDSRTAASRTVAQSS